MIVIGAGRIGTALLHEAQLTGQPCRLISRTEGWDALQGPAGEPILVTVRNDDLDGVVARIPPHRRQDLVLVQNGMLRPWLQEHGLQASTRGILLFAVQKKGDRPHPGGASPFCGPHATAVVAWLQAVGVPAEAVDNATFAEVEVEKLIWNSAFGPLCQRHACDVGTVLDQHLAQTQALVAELLAVAQAAVGVRTELTPLMDRLVHYTRSIADFRGAVKEFRWRNGWFVTEARRRSIDTPVHDRLLREVGVA